MSFQSKNLEKHNTDFEKLIKNQEEVLEYCYLKSGVVGIPGIVRFQVTLNKQNQITEVKAIENSLNDKDLANCLAMRIKALKLDSPDKTRDVTFIVELRFGN